MSEAGRAATISAIVRPARKVSASPIGSYRDAPGLGANTDTVLADWLGLAIDEIDSLRSANVI